MGYIQRLRDLGSADARVLREQLDLIADVINAARFTAPLWAFSLGFLASDAVGYLGHAPLGHALLFAALVTGVSTVAAYLIGRYQSDAASHGPSAALQVWLPRFVIIQISISTSWGLLPWLLWAPGDSVNHMFLAACVGGILGGLAISRANNLDMVVAGMSPVAMMTIVRFVLGGNPFDFGIAIFVAILAIQYFVDGRRLTLRLRLGSRLRFEVEDLARDLADARDEALRKRFEAETANASKTAFLTNMSHELRTPLNAILGFSEIIAKECFGLVGSPRYKEYASDIYSSGSHLLSLINDLLDVAKIEAGRMEIEPEPLDVRRTFDSALKIIATKARERHQTLTIEVEPAIPTLYADERALKQILINLVSNAVKFTPEGGRIAVLGRQAVGGGFELIVEDNGPGIPRDKIDKIFTPFSQVDNRYDRQGGGTGLGLALVRGLAELHGGHAWLESEPGKGCRACVTLPNSAPTSAAA